MSERSESLNQSEEIHFLFNVHIISSTEDSIEYERQRNNFPDNPYLSIELIHPLENELVGYFSYYRRNSEKGIMMPFILRKILFKEEETKFYDISSPYGFAGPQINFPVDKTIMKNFWSDVDHWYKANNVISEFVRFGLYPNYLGYSGETSPKMSMVCGKIIREDQQWENFKPKVRNNVRKARNSDLQVKIYHGNDMSEQCVQEFHKIYIGTMNRHKAELRYYYELELINKFVKRNLFKCAIAITYKGDHAVSAEFLLLSEETIYSFLGGTDEKYFHLRPNDLLKTEVMNWARNYGLKFYFLGGGRSEKDSLYQYKKRFFPNDQDLLLYTGNKIVNQQVYDSLVQKKGISASCNSTNFFPLYRLDKQTQ